MDLEPLCHTVEWEMNHLVISSEAPPQTSPATLLTIPRELRDEIYNHLALSSSFTFLLTCRRINEEGTPLLYKHGIYPIRALNSRKEQRPPRPKPLPSSKIKNLCIYMPPKRDPTDYQRPPYEISHKTARRRLNRFSGTTVQREICHVDLRDWGLSEGLASVLRGFCGFKIVRVESLLRCYFKDDGRYWHYSTQERDDMKETHMQLIEKRLGMALGKAEWKYDREGAKHEGVLIAEFRPRESAQ